MGDREAAGHNRETDPPCVSIVISHFNRSRLLQQTVDSVLAQTFRKWELLIVDDGSDQSERAALNDFLEDPRVRVLDRENGQKGPSRCRNLGAGVARGQWIIFLDSDDLLAPWCLEHRLDIAERHPDQDVLVFPVMVFEATPGDRNLCWNKLEGDADLQRFLSSDPPWHTTSPLWSLTSFRQLGGFNESLIYGDDAELHIRLLLSERHYIKFTDMLPDAFIRRSHHPRITNDSLESMLEERIARLNTIQLLMDVSSSISKNERRYWEGQYFVEAEEILFNLANGTQAIAELLRYWESRCRPSIVYRKTVRFYFFVAVRTINRSFWAVRIARRLVMLLLPDAYFPKTHYNSYAMPDDQFSKVLETLQNASPRQAKLNERS